MYLNSGLQTFACSVKANLLTCFIFVFYAPKAVFAAQHVAAFITVSCCSLYAIWAAAKSRCLTQRLDFRAAQFILPSSKRDAVDTAAITRWLARHWFNYIQETTNKFKHSDSPIQIFLRLTELTVNFFISFSKSKALLQLSLLFIIHLIGLETLIQGFHLQYD